LKTWTLIWQLIVPPCDLALIVPPFARPVNQKYVMLLVLSFLSNENKEVTKAVFSCELFFKLPTSLTVLVTVFNTKMLTNVEWDIYIRVERNWKT
jgi:hypothetical protein